jgi:ABC-type transporter Mla MlaB component
MIVLALDRLGPDDVPDLLERLGPHVVRGETTVVLCDLAELSRADMGTVDALARLALRARRMGCLVSLRDASPELRELLALAGLCEILPCSQGSRLEVVGQPEQREEPLRVEEERDAGDPAVAKLEDLD